VVAFHLRSYDRHILAQFASAIPTTKELLRAQALLWLDEGDAVEEVAQRLLVSRQTVYNWVLRFQLRSDQDLLARLQDAHREGRPPTALGIIDPLVAEVIDTDPRLYGYRHTIWTAPLLRHYLQQVHGISICRKSVSLAIARLGLRWKRPRHVLARRPDTWRYAKGG
jgi:transposase